MFATKVVWPIIAVISVILAEPWILRAEAQETTTASFADVADLPFFDTAVGFSSGSEITIFQAYDDAREIFYIFPNAIDLSQPTFRYQRNGGRFEGRLSATVRVEVSETQALINAKSEITERYANAEFRLVQPKGVRFFFEAWGEKTRLNSYGASVNPYSWIPVSVGIEEPLSNVFLRPFSSTAHLFSISVSYDVSGVVLNSDGSPRIGDRTFVFGRTYGFSCVSRPEQVVNTATGRTGCVLNDSLSGETVSRVQELLRVAGYYRSFVDGIAGPRTRTAIEKYQLDRNQEPMGVANSGLLLQLLQETCDDAGLASSVNSQVLDIEVVCDEI